jgi:hypothetical protein
VYTDVLKKTALQYGPNSPEVMRALIDLDDVFQVNFFLIVHIKRKIKKMCQKIQVFQDVQYVLKLQNPDFLYLAENR